MNDTKINILHAYKHYAFFSINKNDKNTTRTQNLLLFSILIVLLNVKDK